jgi:integrase
MGLSGPWYRASKDSWYVWHGGSQVSLKVRGRRNRKAALDAWYRLLAGGERERNPGPAATVSEVIRGFLQDAAGRVKPKTARWYRDWLEPFAAEYGSLPADELTPTLAEAYSRKPSWSSTSRADFLGTLASAFNWGERSRLVGRNPLLGLRKPPRMSRGAKALITPEEFDRLLRAATPRFRLVLRVLQGTGARPGEAASITAENFDAEAGVVRLAEHKTAHLGKSRTVYLTAELVELLRQQRERYPTGALLRNRRGLPWTGWSLYKAMKATRERAGVPQAICYAARHTFATDALANGVPDSLVAELVGHHGTASLHRNYSHLYARAAALRSALDRVRQ